MTDSFGLGWRVTLSRCQIIQISWWICSTFCLEEQIQWIRNRKFRNIEFPWRQVSSIMEIKELKCWSFVGSSFFRGAHSLWRCVHFTTAPHLIPLQSRTKSNNQRGFGQFLLLQANHNVSKWHINSVAEM